MKKFLMLSAALVFSACSPPAERGAEAPDTPTPQVQACNSIAPDSARLVRIEEAPAVAAAASDLSGGPITPGVYDLTRAVRIGGATGWQDARSVALEVSEGESGVVFQWAGAAAGGEVDRWSAGFTDTPEPRISYTCGRIGEVEIGFTASADNLNLRIPDGADGALYLEFARRT